MKKVICIVLVCMLALIGVVFNSEGTDKSVIENDEIITDNDYRTRASSGKIYYVTLNGNDGNNGESEVNAFRTCYKAGNVAKAGDTVYIKEGVYDGYGNYLNFLNSGTLGNPIKIIGYKSTPNDNPDYTDMPILDGEDDLGYGIEINGKDYIEVSYIRIRDYTTGIIGWASENIIIDYCYVESCGQERVFDGWGIDFSGGSKNATVSNCTVKDISGAGIIMAEHDGGLIDNCTVICDDPDNVIQYYITLSWSQNCIIQNCTITNNQYGVHTGHGFVIKDTGSQGTKTHSYGNIIKDSIATTRFGQGIQAWIGVYDNLYSNITINASDNNGNGITCWTGSHHNTFEDIKIYNAWSGPSLDTYGTGSGSWNNTFKRCLFKGVSVGIFFGETGSDNNTFENCVIDDVNAVYGVGTGSTCQGNEIKNSIINNAKEYKEDAWKGTGTLASSYTCHNDSSNGYTMPTGTGNINLDPLFKGNYHLSPNSKCIDAGDPADVYNYEPEDNGDRINMGIYGNTILASKSSANLRIITKDINDAFEDNEYKVIYSASGQNLSLLTWNYSSSASWLNWGAANHTLFGTPTNIDVGSNWICINITDGHGGYDEHNFTITVSNVEPSIITRDINTAMIDTLYRIDYNCNDDGHGTITWSLATNATWLVIDNKTGVLSGTPDNKDIGWYWVNISVDDGNGGIGFSNFTLRVLNTNTAPSIDTIDTTITYEDEYYEILYKATDIDINDTLDWVQDTNASWLYWGSSNQTLYGTPNNADVGSFWVNISVSDGKGGSDWTNFTLTVINVNDPPIITTIDDNTATEDVLYSVTYNANDIDPTGDALTWFLNTNASWLSMNSKTGILKGTPINSNVGTFWVNVSVSDGNGGMDRHNFTLKVYNINNPPTISTIDVTSATEDISYYVDYNAIDNDSGDTLTWSLNTNALWLSINLNTGHLYGTPTNSDVGSFWVNISVFDGKGGSDWTNFTLSVVNVNDPPIITTIDDNTATEDVLYSVIYSATDIDPTGDVMAWSLVTNASWLSMNFVIRFLTGTPINSNVGTYWVNVSVSDGKGGTDWTNFTLAVINVNDPPTITTSDNKTATEDVTYSVTYKANDIDIGNTLTWFLITNASWLSLNSTTGVLKGLPVNSDVGPYWVNVSVSDESGGTDWTNFTLTVKNTNDPPVITSIDLTIAIEDVIYIKEYKALDIDPIGDILSWSLDTNASWLSLNPTTGYLYGIPTNIDVGWFWVNVSVSDNNGGMDWHNFTVEVFNENNPPLINTTDVTLATEDESYYVDYNAIDNDTIGDTLTWNYSSNAGFLKFNFNTGELSGIPTNSDVGTYWVNISIWDNWCGMSFTNFSLTIINTNDPPTITIPDIVTCTEDLLYMVEYNANDIDPSDDKLTWSFSTNASFLVIDPNTGTLSGIPSNNDVGKYWVEVSISDGKGGLDSSYFILTVLNINDAPSITTPNILTCHEDELYQVNYQAIDVDPSNEIFVWAVSTDALFLSIDPLTGVLSGTPGNDDVGIYWVNITVSDGNGGLDFNKYTLTVLNINDPPIIQTSDVTNINEDHLYRVDYNALDIDPTIDEITWRLSTDAPFLLIDSETGILSGIPTNNDVGTYWVNISVSDGKGGFDFGNFVLNVINTNDPPTITNPDITTCFEDQLYRVNYHAMDFDPTGDTFTWELFTDAQFLSIDPITGELSGTPKDNDVGSYWVDLSVSDGKGGFDSHYFILTVENVNDPPTNVTIELEDIVYFEGGYQWVYGNAKDPDLANGDNLTFVWYSDLVGEIGTGHEINLSLSSGNHEITLDVTDIAGTRSYLTIQLEILPNQDIVEDIDIDGDGFLDAWEEFLGTDPIDPMSIPLDTDSDGRPDGDQNNSQSWMDDDDDDDGYSDQEERDKGSDPLNDRSKPKKTKDNKKKVNERHPHNFNNMYVVMIGGVIFIIITLMLVFLFVPKRKKGKNKKDEILKEERLNWKRPLKIPLKKLPLKRPKKILISQQANKELELPLKMQQSLSCEKPQYEMEVKEEDYEYECPSCGTDLNEEDIICPKCNEEFEEEEFEEDVISEDVLGLESEEEQEEVEESVMLEENLEEELVEDLLGQKIMPKEIVEEIDEDYYCPICSIIIGTEINICPKCGVEFEELHEEYECPDCGTDLGMEIDICPKCGTEFEE